MILITSVVYDGAGDEKSEKARITSTAGEANHAFAAAEVWATHRLRELDDPDAYVEHTIERT